MRQFTKQPACRLAPLSRLRTGTCVSIERCALFTRWGSRKASCGQHSFTVIAKLIRLVEFTPNLLPTRRVWAITLRVLSPTAPDPPCKTWQLALFSWVPTGGSGRCNSVLGGAAQWTHRCSLLTCNRELQCFSCLQLHLVGRMVLAFWTNKVNPPLGGVDDGSLSRTFPGNNFCD